VNLKALWYDSKVHVGLTLFLIWLLAIWQFRTDLNILRIILYPILAIFTIALFDVGLTHLRYRKNYLPTATVVSGFLIGLILAPSEPIWVIIAASILVSFSKQFIAFGIRRHILNPAAFGIIGVNLIFDTTVSWWGVAWGWFPLVILVPLMLRILWRLHRLYLPIGFLTFYALYLLISQPFDFVIRTLTDPTVLMFALVMLPEPVTSPVNGYFKYGFGVFVAIIAIIFSNFGKLSEIFLPALLFSNLVTFYLIKIQKYSK